MYDQIKDGEHRGWGRRQNGKQDIISLKHIWQCNAGSLMWVSTTAIINRLAGAGVGGMSLTAVSVLIIGYGWEEGSGHMNDLVALGRSRDA